MTHLADRAIAIVGLGAILPDAPDATTFWANLVAGRSSITEVPRERWDPELYYDADPRAPDKTYSKIGGWVRDWDWSPLAWRLPVPPRTSEAIDDAQKWAVACARAALLDSGWPGRPLDQERTAVILGNAMGGGEKHYQTARRVAFPETVRDLGRASSFRALPAAVQAAVIAELRDQMNEYLPKITEDTMPGELGNCVACGWPTCSGCAARTSSLMPPAPRRWPP